MTSIHGLQNGIFGAQTEVESWNGDAQGPGPGTVIRHQTWESGPSSASEKGNTAGTAGLDQDQDQC